MHRFLTLCLLASASPARPGAEQAGLELSIAAGGEVRGSRIVGSPESSLVFCVEEVVRRWGASAFASARRDTTLLIPLGRAAEGEGRPASPAKGRLALPWGFMQDLAGCRGQELVRDQPADCVTTWTPPPPCSAPLEADVALTVRADGSVESARVSAGAGPPLPSTECLERAARRWRFPEFAGVAHQVGARVLLAPGTPCSDPALPDVPPPQPEASTLPVVPLSVGALIIVALGAVAVARWRRRR